MDACSDRASTKVVLLAASQVGKTEVILNVVGRNIDVDPCPMLVLLPSGGLASTWSEQRLDPMLAASPSLRKKVRDKRERDSGNTKKAKAFAGGHITITTANSATELSSRPIRIVLCDEVDRYPYNVGGEGDPVALAFKRTSTFWNKKLVLISSPTVAGLSRIQRAYDESDQRRYWMPCPHCGAMQTLQWAQVKFDKADVAGAHYVCVENGCVITDADKLRMLRDGEWRAEKPFNGVAGFWINGIYSPFITFAEMAAEHLEAKQSRETLQAWVNTFLAECWEDEESDHVDAHFLQARIEKWKDAPADVLLVTAGVDVQADRLEVELVGWGKDEESWSLGYHVFHGDPNDKRVWERLTELRRQAVQCADGRQLSVYCMAVDTGYLAQPVYDYCKAFAAENVFAVKGRGGAGLPVISRPSKNNRARIKLFTVGTDGAKEWLYSRLLIEAPGAGYCHFPAERDEEYFAQLTAERRRVKYVNGRPVYEWKQTRARNEALDVRIYALAALHIANVNLDALARSKEAAAVGAQERPANSRKNAKPARKSWVNRQD